MSIRKLAQPEPDGLYTPSVKPWSSDKHHYLFRYMDIFTSGMKNQTWQLHYVDLFSNAGVANVEGQGLQWGSALLAAQTPHPFAKLHLCEKDTIAYEALETRIQRFPQPLPPQLICGDANEHIDDIVQEIPERNTLTLAFIDPYGLHAKFDTLRKLSAGRRRVDFVIFFPDHVDALRNLGLYDQQDESNLDMVLGSRDWRNVVDSTPANRRAESLRVFYQDRLVSIGYSFFDHVRIRRTDGVPLYVLLFCSGHKRGGDFWKKISKLDRGGQGSLDF